MNFLTPEECVATLGAHCWEHVSDLEVDWETLEAGRYEIELWYSYDSFSREYDGGLRFVDARIES